VSVSVPVPVPSDPVEVSTCVVVGPSLESSVGSKVVSDPRVVEVDPSLPSSVVVVVTPLVASLEPIGMTASVTSPPQAWSDHESTNETRAIRSICGDGATNGVDVGGERR